MKITDYLDVEHGLLHEQLDHVRSLLEQGATSLELMAAVKTVAVALNAHQEAEERFLLPLVRETFGHGLPMLRMIEDQEAEIAEILSSLEHDPERVARFVELLRRHIEEETKILFPMIEDRVPTSKLQNAGERCLQARIPRGTPPGVPS